MGRHSISYLQSLVIGYWESKGYTLEELHQEEAALIERIKDEINANHANKPTTSEPSEPDPS